MIDLLLYKDSTEWMHEELDDQYDAILECVMERLPDGTKMTGHHLVAAAILFQCFQKADWRRTDMVEGLKQQQEGGKAP